MTFLCIQQHTSAFNSGHMFPVWDVAFAATSPYYFASAGADRMTRVWCTERLHPLRMLAGHQADVDVVRWHPNAHYVATGSSDRTVRLWDVSSGKCVRLLTEHRAPVTALACSPDGHYLASGDANGAVLLWDLGSARKVAISAQHDGPVWSLAFSNGHVGTLLVSGVWEMNHRYNAMPTKFIAQVVRITRCACGTQRLGMRRRLRWWWARAWRRCRRRRVGTRGVWGCLACVLRLEICVLVQEVSHCKIFSFKQFCHHDERPKAARLSRCRRARQRGIGRCGRYFLRCRRCWHTA